MKNGLLKRVVLIITSLTIALAAVLFPAVIKAQAEEDDPLIVVSMGDSYSSGEGIEPFFGQDARIESRVTDSDWLGHRSTKSWASMLRFQGLSGTLGDYRSDYPYSPTGSSNARWYFVASSGATTAHFKKRQEKTINRDFYDDLKMYLSPQLDIFSKCRGEVDYVTFSIGGNDVGFADIIINAAAGSTYLDFSNVKKMLNEQWDKIEETKTNIRNAYKSVFYNAGSQVKLLIAGYPKLLDQNGHGALISLDEATMINNSVSRFNLVLSGLVRDVASMDLGQGAYFIDVEGTFNGHEAYASGFPVANDTEWINRIILIPQSQDLETKKIGSAYSVHPNAKGAQAYAECVNEKIRQIEAEGMLSGKICKAADRETAIADAEIIIEKDGRWVRTYSNANGTYSITLKPGTYLVSISAPGYIDFQSYATVVANEKTYMETFLLVEGSEDETGIASGMITDSLTGNEIEGVTLSARKGWNNTTGDVIGTASTDSSGNYSISLPLGNYTLQASKAGYISDSFNIIVQQEETRHQNGTLTPLGQGDSYRIVLTWGENPSDLDSHVVGTLSDGSPFHVYYSDKSQYDGDIEVCNLDVDDTTSYGPETITLNVTTDKPYYYYIYRYAGSGTVASSEAQIKVFQGENPIAVYNVPTDQGSGDYWNVFAVKGGEIIVKNTITSSADITYADSENGDFAQDVQMMLETDAQKPKSE